MPGLMNAGGGKLVITKIGDVNFFYGGSINIKNVLPDVYNKLTKEQIFVEPANSYLAWNDPDGRDDMEKYFSKSYDQKTGVLTISAMGAYYNNRLNGGLRTCTVYVAYVK